MIDRSFLFWLPTQSTNRLDLNVKKYSLKIEPNSNLNRKIIKVNLHDGRCNPKAAIKKKC